MHRCASGIFGPLLNNGCGGARLCSRQEGARQEDCGRSRHQGTGDERRGVANMPSISNFSVSQVVDKSRYAAGDNSLEREIQVLLKVRSLGCPLGQGRGGVSGASEKWSNRHGMCCSG